MAAIKKLVDLKDLDGDCSASFKAESDKVTLFIEDKTNVATLSLYVKGIKNHVYLTGMSGHNQYKLELTKGLEYKVSGLAIPTNPNKGKPVKGSLFISAVWEA